MAISRNRKNEQPISLNHLEDFTSAGAGTIPNRQTYGKNRGDYWLKVQNDIIRQTNAIAAGKGHPQPQNKLSPAKSETTMKVVNRPGPYTNRSKK
jgi:hypothetical protein